MKTGNKFGLGLAALALLATGCAKEQVKTQRTIGDEGSSSLVVKIASPRATRNIVTPADQANVDNFEKNVMEFTAYLFDGTGGFLEQASTEPGSDQIVFASYAPNDEVQVVAIANPSTDASIVLPTPTVGDDIGSVFTDAALQVAATTQLVANADLTDPTKGLLMSGQYGVGSKGNLTDSDAVAADGVYTLVQGLNTITVPVERVVAKVQLGNITFGDDVTLTDLANFSLTGVGIQRAMTSSYLYPGEIMDDPANTTFYGGFADSTSSTQNDGFVHTDVDGLIDLEAVTKALLQGVEDNLATLVPGAATRILVEPLLTAVLALTGDAFVVSDELLGYIGDLGVGEIVDAATGINLQSLIVEPSTFFYVLPNAGTLTDAVNNGSATTLFTLAANYDGDDYYYPVEINTVDGTADTTDGTGIRRNTIYNVSVQFNSLIGTDNPDDPAQGTNLVVLVEPIEWEGSIDQNATW